MKDVSVYLRGQVWFIYEEEVNEQKGSIQDKSRPCLIVSNNNCNMYSPVIHVAPITSQEKYNYPTHVSYLDMINQKSTILCEQIVPKSVPHISKRSRYMYTLSSDIMEKVDRAILSQFDLLSYEKEVRKEKCASTPTPHYSEDTEKRTPANIIQPKISHIESFSKSNDNDKETGNIFPGSVKIERSAKGKIIWSPALKSQLIKDASIMSGKDLADKYNIKAHSCQTLAAKFRKNMK